MRACFLIAAATVVTVASIGSAAPLFSDSFDSPTNGNWTVLKGSTDANIAADSTTQSAEFGFNYSSFDIPSATGTADTTGLRLRSNLYGGVQSGLSAFLTGYSLPSTYVIQFRAWSNYTKTGTNSTEAAAYGVGSGAKAQVVVNSDGVVFAALRDNAASTSGTYRTYTNGAFSANVKGNTAANLANFPQKTFVQGAPVNGVETDNTVTTVAGTDSFAWRTVTITNDGTNITWSLTNDAGTPVLLSTVTVASLTTAATNAFLGSFDTTPGSSAADEGSLAASAPATFNFELFDNFTVSAVPEPTSLAVLGAAGALLGRRRR